MRRRVSGTLDRPRPSHRCGMICQSAVGTQPGSSPPHEFQVIVQFPASSTAVCTRVGAAGPSTLVDTTSGGADVCSVLMYAETMISYLVLGKSPVRLTPSWPCTVTVAGGDGASLESTRTET